MLDPHRHRPTMPQWITTTIQLAFAIATSIIILALAIAIAAPLIRWAT